MRPVDAAPSLPDRSTVEHIFDLTLVEFAVYAMSEPCRGPRPFGSFVSQSSTRTCRTASLVSVTPAAARSATPAGHRTQMLIAARSVFARRRRLGYEPCWASRRAHHRCAVRIAHWVTGRRDVVGRLVGTSPGVVGHLGSEQSQREGARTVNEERTGQRQREAQRAEPEPQRPPAADGRRARLIVMAYRRLFRSSSARGYRRTATCAHLGFAR